MGVDYTSYAVIGVKIDPEKLYIEETKRGCNCEKTPTEKFCSDCGAKSFIESKEPIASYDEDENVLGYRILWGTNCEKAVIAISWSEDDDYGQEDNSFAQIPNNLEELKNKMKNALGPVGLWDEKNFGLWSVIHCSY